MNKTSTDTFFALS